MFKFKNEKDYITFLEDNLYEFSKHRMINEYNDKITAFIIDKLDHRDDNKFDKDKAWQAIKGNEYLKRSIEIALAGNHKITVTGNPDNGYDNLKIILGDLLEFSKPCKCGNFKNSYLSCNCTPKQILRYQNKIKEFDNPITTELVTPINSDYNVAGESFEMINKRIDISIDPCYFMKLDQSAKDLLNSFMQRYQLTFKRHSQILLVAQTIATLDHLNEIKAFHISEALQYQIIKFKDI